MIKTVESDTSGLAAYLNSAKGDVLPYRQILDMLRAAIPFTEAVIVTSLPRGSLQIVQPPRLAETLLRGYSKTMHLHDRLTWKAIAAGKAVRGSDAWPADQFATSLYRTELLEPNGFAHAASAPLSAPVLDGYPGAIHLYRDGSHADFTNDELDRLMRFAEQLDTAIVRTRQARHTVPCSNDHLAHRPPVRQIIFDSRVEPALPQADLLTLDERLRENILEDARHRIGHVNGKQLSADRVPLPDSRGDLWHFRVTIHREYPALAEGPVVFFCLSPACCDWSVLRPADFQADSELSRLIPALKFMREQFHRGPTLVEIARTVHLSPFHFHRRFTELLGITPKHFLLDCQIMQAKRDLLSGIKDLAQIATECGFAHQSHFTSRFKQATGLTPTRWRRMAMESRKANAGN